MTPSAELGRIAEEMDDVAVWCKLAADETHERAAAGNFLSMRDRMHQISASLRAVAAGLESATAGDALGMLEKLAVERGYIEICSYRHGEADESWAVQETDTDTPLGRGPTLLAAIRAAATGGEG